MGPSLARVRRGVAAAALALTLAPGAASAADGDVGWSGLGYGIASDSTTATKPESKLWFNRGWWATMLHAPTKSHHIFRLDRATQRWLDSGVVIERRAGDRGDVLWDAATGKLYVAFHKSPPLAMTSLPESEDAPPPPPPAAGSPPPTPPPPGPTPTQPPLSTNPARLYRFSYDPVTDGYALDPGFPALINTVDSETLVIAKDSTGTLWATWTAGNQVYVSHTVGSDDATWTHAYPLPVEAATMTQDDIASVVAFGGNRIGVLWSNQHDGRFHFAVHADGTGDGPLDWSAVALPGGANADDHINLKSDAAGRVYAAVKHSETDADDPSLSLLVRTASGSWSRSTVARVKDAVTRPIVVLDEHDRRVNVFFTGPQPPDDASGDGGGTIYTKTSSMGSIKFGAGWGTPVIRDAASSDVNDATSTKQSLDASTGIVVQANNGSTNTYWHHDSLSPPFAAVMEARGGPVTGAPQQDPQAAEPPAGTGSGAPAPAQPPAAPPLPPAPHPGPRPTTPPPLLSRLTVAAVQRGSAVRGTGVIGQDASELRAYARIRGRQAIAGRAPLDLRPAGRAAFRIVLTRTAQAALRRSRRLTLIVTVRVTPPSGRSVTARRRVVIRPRASMSRSPKRMRAAR